jgi:DNA-binding transcriptional LysR family regulator
MLDSLRGLLVFAHVAETASFSRAAERLAITRSAVSKQVAQLESELGVQLVVRTTRRVVLTEAGERVYEASARLAGDVEAAREAAMAQSAQVAGSLRVTAPSALGRDYLIPVVAEFMALHPAVTVEVVLGDAFVDLVAERIDVAVRVGGRAEQSLVSRKISSVEALLVGAPSYLARHGTPRAPAGLASHRWVMHTPGGSAPRVTLRRGSRTATVQPKGDFACNDGPANIAAARAGLGLLVAPDFEVAGAVRDGSLVRLLPSWRVDMSALHLVFPPRRHVLARVRAFADLLALRFAERPWRCDGR